MKRLTTDEVIRRFKNTHGDRYSYELVEYIDYKTKVKILCPVHGVFEQIANEHKNGNGCPKCGIIEATNKKRLTTDGVIRRFKNTHGEKYSYELVDYINNKTKVKIICPEHGVFEQRTNDHLNGHGCVLCGINKGKQTTEELIEKCIILHGDKYSYDLVDYVNNKTKVKIVCSIHGVFEQRTNDHLNGHGCPKCNDTKLTTEQFITKAKEVHGNKYSYELVEYVNYGVKVKIICPEHGVFEQAPANHLSGQGCPECGGSIKSTTKQFTTKAKEVHGDRYSYELVDYVNAKTKVRIICPEHGVFEQRPNDHLNGHGCQKCAQIISKQEIEFTDYIRSLYDGTVITNSREVIPPYELDVYLPDLAIAFEYNGMYWHNEGVTKPVGYHDMKTDRCKKLSIELYHIWEDDWMNNREECERVVEKIVL